MQYKGDQSLIFLASGVGVGMRQAVSSLDLYPPHSIKVGHIKGTIILPQTHPKFRVGLGQHGHMEFIPIWLPWIHPKVWPDNQSGNYDLLPDPKNWVGPGPSPTLITHPISAYHS